MRNLLIISLLTSLISATTIAPSPTPTPTPTTLTKRDSLDDDISSRLSSLVSSATHALDERPEDASSVMSELREQYTSIAGEATTGCDSSSWARITNAVGEFDDGIFDGIANLADEIFGDGDRDGECESSSATRRTVALGIVGAGLLGVAAVL